MDRDEPEPDGLWDDFHELVNMSPDELREWLEETSEGADTYPEEPDIDIRTLGERTLVILAKRRTDLTDADIEVMSEVVDEISELLDNRPKEQTAQAQWRATLMTMGHDPTGDAGDLGSDI